MSNDCNTLILITRLAGIHDVPISPKTDGQLVCKRCLIYKINEIHGFSINTIYLMVFAYLHKVCSCDSISQSGIWLLKDANY